MLFVVAQQPYIFKAYSFGMHLQSLRISASAANSVSDLRLHASAPNSMWRTCTGSIEGWSRARSLAALSWTLESSCPHLVWRSPLSQEGPEFMQLPRYPEPESILLLGGWQVRRQKDKSPATPWLPWLHGVAALWIRELLQVDTGWAPIIFSPRSWTPQ